MANEPPWRLIPWSARWKSPMTGCSPDTRKSPTVRQIWRDAYGDDFPDKAEPLSYVTLTDLRRIASTLGVGPGATIVNLGSG